MAMNSKFSGWRKSRHSNSSGACVEIASAADGTTGVRDSKQHGRGPVLELTGAQWKAFRDAAKKGAFDL
jgi:hypothetical protein